MSFQVEIGSLGGNVFFQVGLCTPLRTKSAQVKGATLGKYENLALLDALKIHFRRFSCIK